MNLTQKYLCSILDYNPETGIFIWKYRTHISSAINVRDVGRVAGSLNNGLFTFRALSYLKSLIYKLRQGGVLLIPICCMSISDARGEFLIEPHLESRIMGFFENIHISNYSKEIFPNIFSSIKFNLPAAIAIIGGAISICSPYIWWGIAIWVAR